ncbi:MAG: type II secretion system F family protein, partial [Acidimicrobiales bacterium]
RPAAGRPPGVGRIRAGSTMAEALTRWADWLGHPDARLVVATLQLGDRMGAPMAPALDRTAAMLRQRATLTDELVSLSAQARASARVLALAPVGFATIVALADPATAGRLFATGFGRVSLAVGLVLDGLGLWWMRRLVSAVRP